MAKGRKAKTALPEFIEVSEDGKKIRCEICEALRDGSGGEKGGWIKKESLASHLRTDAHNRSVHAKQNKQLDQAVGERSVLEEEAFEKTIDFVQLMSSTKPAAMAKLHAPKPSIEEQEMWANHATSSGIFDAGIDHTLVAVEERRRLEQEATNFDLWGAAECLSDEGTNDSDLLLDELEQDDILTELLQNTHLDSTEVAGLLAEDVRGYTMKPQNADAWSPYESKTMFLLDALDNIPRVRVSNLLMKVFLWVLCEAGARDVPSFHHLREVQASIRKSSGVPTIQHTSPKRNVYFMNDPRTLIAMDWANPTTCDHIHRYPVIPLDGIVSEIYHAQKWRKDVDRHTLSPMYNAGDRHFYIDELARLKSNQFIIPVQWLEKADGKVFADAYPVTFDAQFIANVESDHILIAASELQYNFLDLKDMNLLPTWNNQTIESGYAACMPNPDRALAEGNPLYTSWIDIFCDDVSGNRSKSWNKHWNTYINHRNLPRKFLQQQFHTHFVSTSPVASNSEQFHGIKYAIESTHKKPVKVRLGSSGAQIRFKIYVNSGPGDNPAQSEICGHIGGNGNHPCRKCHAGGTKEFKETDTGFHSLFEPSAARSAKEILEDVKSQVESACLGVAQTVQTQQTKNGIKDTYTQYWIDYLINRARTLHKESPERTIADIQKELMTWVEERKGDIYNPFLTLDGFDPAIDTPVEILHTILLGIVKYLWHNSHTPWSASQKQRYSIRLQSTNTSGLSIHAIRANYIMQYANSLIGRQFKTIAQVNIFHVYDLVDSNLFLLTKAVGELATLLWIPEIRNMEHYLSDVEVAAANVLDLFAMIDPLKMTSKIKLHLLVHLKADILHFGPLVGVATEVFECFNAIFRYCSIYSNHLAPSRDIAFQFASQEAMKHRLTGGWWQSTDGEWKQPGPSVRNFILSNATLQGLVGWTTTEPHINGSFKLEPLKRDASQKNQSRKYIPWVQTQGAKAVNSSEEASSEWAPCRFTVARSGDKCSTGSWIFARSPFNARERVTSRIIEILANSKGDRALIVLDTFQVVLARHDIFGMPMLARRYDEAIFIVIPSTDIDFLYNVQHDCPLAKCTVSGKQAIMQERVESGLFKTYIEHRPIKHFVINTHAFHNAHLLRETLPRSIISPIPLYQLQDRHTKHTEFAGALRVARAKRTETKVQAEQKRGANDHMAGSRPNKRMRLRIEGGALRTGALHDEVSAFGGLVSGDLSLSLPPTLEHDEGLSM